MESVTSMGMVEGRGANWAEARLGVRGLKAGAKILRAAGDKPSGIDRAPGFVLALILWGASRASFREAVGNSDGEVRGLVDLYVAEACSIGGLDNAIDALQALCPGGAPRTGAVLRAA